MHFLRFLKQEKYMHNNLFESFSLSPNSYTNNLHVVVCGYDTSGKTIYDNVSQPNGPYSNEFFLDKAWP